MRIYFPQETPGKRPVTLALVHQDPLGCPSCLYHEVDVWAETIETYEGGSRAILSAGTHCVLSLTTIALQVKELRKEVW